MYFYAKNSDDRLGKENPTKELDLKNEFISRDQAPKTFFVDPKNRLVKAEYDPKNDQVVFKDGQIIKTVDYLNNYYKENHVMPFLKISYGSFHFYNQYIEAVSPAEFYKFTE
ncbi:UNVERIFIED_CONTAM: hypothetical protein O8I53_06250 [Campylobacter lari]